MIRARRTEVEVPLTLSITRSNGPVIGATAVVAVRDGNTNDSYLDFADATFKTAGWTTRQAALADIGGGFYALTGGLDVAAITNLPAATEILLAEFEVTAPANALGVSVDEILIDGFVDDIEPDIDAILIDTGTTIPGLIAALNDLAQSDILSDATPFAGADIETIRKIETNRWRIDTGANTLTFFDDDGTTPLFVFDLLDAAAAPSTGDVFERDPV